MQIESIRELSNKPIPVVAHRVRPRAAPQLSLAQTRFMREMRSNPGPLVDVAHRADIAMPQLSRWMRSSNFRFHVRRFAQELDIATGLERKIGRARGRAMMQRIANGELSVPPVRFKALTITTSTDPAPRDSDGRYLPREKSGHKTNVRSSVPGVTPHNPFHPSVTAEEARKYVG